MLGETRPRRHLKGAIPIQMRISEFEGVVQDLEAKAKLTVLSSCTGLQEGTQELEKTSYMLSWNQIECMGYI